MTTAFRPLAAAVFSLALVVAAAGLTAPSAEAGPKGPRSNVSGLDLGSGR